MHDDHQGQYGQQIEGKQGHGGLPCEPAKQRGHEAVADVGTGHLHADNGLGLVRAEVGRGDGRSKKRAEQEAARVAIEKLFPGVNA